MLADAGVAAPGHRSRPCSTRLPSHGMRDCASRRGPGADLAQRRPSLPRAGFVPHNTAYVIYTSGSTGRPKGVVGHARNVVRLFDTTRDLFRLRPRRRLDAVSLLRLRLLGLGDLGRAAARRPARRRPLRRPVALPRSSDRCSRGEGVTVLNQTPSAFCQLMRGGAGGLRFGASIALRYVIFGGEALELRQLGALVPSLHRTMRLGSSTCTASPRRRCTSRHAHSTDLAATATASSIDRSRRCRISGSTCWMAVWSLFRRA